MPERVYRNRRAGEECIHVELTPVDILNLLRDVTVHPHATASTQAFVSILQESHGVFLAAVTDELRAAGIEPAREAPTPGQPQPAQPGTTPPGTAGPHETAVSRPAPRRLDCPQQCPIPDGVTVAEVPPPRHTWGDVFACPNTGCGRHLLIKPTTAATDQSKEQ